MIYIGIVSAENFGLYPWPVIFAGEWQEVIRDEKPYKRIAAFKHYFTQEAINQVDLLFETEEEYQVWYESTDIVPTFLIVEPHTNHPLWPDYTRTCTAVKMPALDFKYNSMSIALEVRTYAAGAEQKQLFERVELIADNSTLLPTATGGTIGEYDYLIGLMRQGVTIEQILRSCMQNRSADGTIDRKIGFIL